MLSVRGASMLRLSVSFQCEFDHRAHFLAVDESEIVVRAVGASEPLFRYDYLRSPASSQAGAHVQVHAHRDAISHLLATCGDNTRRARDRQRAAVKGDRLPQLSDLHLPLGGSRFRPCLEDVLQTLIDEFGVDAPDGALAALAEGRAEWRRKQLGAAVRDSPEVAARVLRALGYAVAAPIEVPPERLSRLTAM